MKLALFGMVICTAVFIIAPSSRVIMMIGMWASSYELYKELNREVF